MSNEEFVVPPVEGAPASEEEIAIQAWLRKMERPLRKPVPWWSEEHLDGDYAKHGSMQATEWGE
jgi:hypothetical protein